MFSHFIAGTGHESKNSPVFSYSPVAFQLAEIFEAVQVFKGSGNISLLPHLQPHKLWYANYLAEHGLVETASKYIKTISHVAKENKGSQHFSVAFITKLTELEDRLNVTFDLKNSDSNSVTSAGWFTGLTTAGFSEKIENLMDLAVGVEQTKLKPLEKEPSYASLYPVPKSEAPSSPGLMISATFSHASNFSNISNNVPQINFPSSNFLPFSPPNGKSYPPYAPSNLNEANKQSNQQAGPPFSKVPKLTSTDDRTNGHLAGNSYNYAQPDRVMDNNFDYSAQTTAYNSIDESTNYTGQATQGSYDHTVPLASDYYSAQAIGHNNPSAMPDGAYNYSDQAYGTNDDHVNPKSFDHPAQPDGTYNFSDRPYGTYNEPVNPESFETSSRPDGNYNLPAQPDGADNYSDQPYGTYHDSVQPESFDHPVQPNSSFAQPGYSTQPYGSYANDGNNAFLGGIDDYPAQTGGLLEFSASQPSRLQPPMYQEESIEDLGFGNSSGKKLENKMTESKLEEPLKKVVKKTSIFSSIFGIFGSREPLPPQAHLPVGSGFVFEGGKWFNKNKPMDESPPAIAPPPRNAPMPSAGPNMLSTSPTQPNTRAPPTSGPHAAPSKNIRSKYVDVFNNGAQAAAIPTPIITSFVPNYQVSASSPPKMVFFINESSFPKYHLTNLLHLMTLCQQILMKLRITPRNTHLKEQ
jgi:hypothetical protein